MEFQGIYSHKRQIEVLKRAVMGEKVPHAYLFVGAGGIGKKLVALNLAQALQCTSSDEKPCGSCEGCRKTAGNNHPDVILLEPEGNYIKIEQVRELQKRLAFKPFEGNVTVCIIDGADMMNIAAANALLKTVEEPPPATHIILLAENTEQVIPTIISRCQRLKFNSLPITDIENILIGELGLPRDEAMSVARMSEGSAGRALTFLKLFPDGEKDKILNAIIDIKEVEGIFSVAEELTKKGSVERLMEILEIIKFFLRDIVIAKMGMEKEMIINWEELQVIEKVASRHPLKRLIEMVEAVSKAEAAIMMNANKRLAIESMLLKIFKGKEGLCQ